MADADPSLRSAFHAELRGQTRTSGLLVGILATFTLPTWSFFDYALEPAMAPTFTVARFLITIPLITGIALFYWHRTGRTHPEYYTFALIFTIALAIAWMIPRVENSLEGYLLGYSMVIYGSTFLAVWRVRWTVASLVAVFGLLALSYALHPENLSVRAAAVCGYYLSTAGLLTTLAALHRDRVEFREFASRVGMIRERERADRLLAELEQLSRRDPLTGAANRREWDAVLDREWSLARRSGRPLSVILMDIDHFKQINDRHGHEAGDLALREVTELIRGRIRSTDVLARLGGDELAILCPDTAVEPACALAAGILAQARELVLADLPDLRLALSLGVAMRAERDSGPGDLVKRADQQLYQAKRTRGAVWGCNRRWDAPEEAAAL